jgi:hypothetical protein
LSACNVTAKSPSGSVVGERFHELADCLQHLLEACIVWFAHEVALGAAGCADYSLRPANVLEPFICNEPHVVGSEYATAALCDGGGVAGGGLFAPG